MSDWPTRLAVAYSGGKDSTYLLIKAVDAGLDVVAIVVDTGYLSPSAHKNIAKVPARLNIPVVVVPDIPAFRSIYLFAYALIPTEPFYMCAQCHLHISELVTTMAARLGCGEIWHGMSPDEVALLPAGTTIEDFRKHSFAKTPLFDEPYDPQAVIRKVKERFPDFVTNPFKTNCAMNMVIIHDYYKAHRTNPYANMFAEHPWKTRWWFSFLLWIGYWSGHLRRVRDRIIREMSRERKQ